MLTFDGANFGKFDLIRWQTCILNGNPAQLQSC